MIGECRKKWRNLLLQSAPAGQCCITVTPQEFFLVYTRQSGDKLVLEFCASYPYDRKEGLKDRLSSIVKQYRLKNTNCTWVLAPQDYQLLQMDVLPVAKNEFQAAIRWKIKDLLRFSIDDVVIDRFEIPSSKLNPKNNKMVVVASQASYLQKTSQDIQEAGLNLSTIDIPELALRNMMALFEQENQSHALIYIQETMTYLLITYQKKLYFIRNLEFGWGEEEKKTEHVEQLAVEIQRSFDYYQNQWREPAPTQITLASTRFISQEAIDELSQSLALPVQWLTLDGKLLAKQEINIEQQGKYLPIIGELFRKEYENRHATTN